jgi:hypothetical protein
MILRQTCLKLPYKRGGVALMISLFFILLGSRAVLINYAANPTPFFDDWDGAAVSLLNPYLQGRLTIGDLLAPYNEHRLFFTRLLVLSIFHVSGYWDVILQMIVNAIVDSATVVAIGYALARVLCGGWAIAAMIVCIAINAVPYGYDNVLWGFNTHFYLLNAFSLGSLWLLVGSKAFTPRWGFGVLAAIASYLCMASGAFTTAAAAAAHLLQAACSRRAGLREGLGIAALAAITVAMLALIPHVPASDPYKAHSLRQFLVAFVQLASWPANNGLGLVLFLPSALFLTRTLADRADLSDPRWLNLAALAWVLGLIVALAAGRAQWPNQSRYTDALLVGSMINLVSGLWFFESAAIGGRRSLWRSLLLATWLCFFALSLTHPQRHLRKFIDERRDIAIAEEKNVRGYLATGDASFLAGPPGIQIPYYEAGRLKELLDTPEIRSTLAPELLPRDSPRPWVEAFKRVFTRLGFVWLGVGGLLLAAVIGRMAFTSRKLASHDLARERLPR